MVTVIVFGIQFQQYIQKKREKVLRTRDKKKKKKQISYAAWILLGSNATLLLSQIDQQIAIVFLGKAAAGYWTNTASLVSAIGIVTGPII